MPHIHSGLVDLYVKDQMPKDAQFIGDAAAPTRMNLTPNTKYNNIYSMMNPPHSSCLNTLGFDDGLQRVRSNFRRVDSSEHFALDNNTNLRSDIQIGGGVIGSSRNN